MKPPPLLMVCLHAFGLALLAFSLALVAPIGLPAWQWTLNAAALLYGLTTAGSWLRRALRD